MYKVPSQEIYRTPLCTVNCIGGTLSTTPTIKAPQTSSIQVDTFVSFTKAIELLARCMSTSVCNRTQQQTMWPCKVTVYKM